MGATAVSATPASPYTITVAQTSDLTDGTPVPVVVTSSDPAADPVGWVDIRLCRPGVAYTTYAVVETRGNCGFSPGSSAYASVTGSATQDFPGETSGARSFPDRFIAGVGTASFAGSSLTCDATAPCDLVVSVFDSETQFEGTTAETVESFPLTYLPFGGVAGCRGTDANALQTVSSDRLVEAYTDWSRAACADGPGGGKAPTEDTFVDEGGAFGAVGSFAQGDADMTYAAGGYDLPGFSEPTGRPYVAVPLALNAVVVSASGGQQVAAYTPAGSPAVTTSAPFDHLDLTAGQAAAIFGGGYVSPKEAAAIQRQNPELTKGAQIVPYTPPGSSTFIYPQAVAGVNATTIFASTYFSDIARKYWTSGPYARSGQRANVRRGVFSSFAEPGASEPAFNSLGLYSHRTDLERAALPYAGIGPLPLWVLTDLATATELGFTVASLNGSGRYIAPTRATMDEAVHDMKVAPDGTLLPDPTKADADKKRAYPLTFVEYALVPTEPLVDASCHVRTGSEQLMIKWIQFLTGRGQHDLAPGLQPLTAALHRDATAAIAKIGRAAPTGACGPKAKAPVLPTTTPTTSPPVPVTTAPVTTAPVTTAPVTTAPVTTAPVTRSPASTTPRKAGASPGHRHAGVATGTSSPTTAAPAAGSQHLAAVSIPRFAGRHRTDWALPCAALLILGLLTGGMALRTSGRSVAALAAVTRRLRRRPGSGAS
jgi:hypothetical protein